MSVLFDIEEEAPQPPRRRLLEQMLTEPDDRTEERHTELLEAQERTFNVLERLLLRTPNTTHAGGG